jgi:beta-1,4-mannosyltransferase
VQINVFYVLLSVLGYKVIWTVHNVVPQFPQSPNDALLMKRLGKLAKAKIIHSTSALENLDGYGISTKGTNLIPHGNYKGVYPEAVTRTEARRRLALKPTDIVLLFFGNVAPYKGVDTLLELTDKLDAPNVQLVIAGQCYNEALRERIDRSVQLGRTQYRSGYIKDEDVAMYFKAADIVCLPFTAITTSGSAILALTFGKPVIAPRMGALKDIPEEAGYFYEPADPRGLASSLRLAVSDPGDLAQRGRAAGRYAQSLNWSILAEKTYDVYQRVLVNKASDNS